ncbi:MAG: acyl-protein synthetase [Lachnospiraceae bacterium]|nr:acyl-protein synthetase [Lachnospiraceae bacterium]
MDYRKKLFRWKDPYDIEGTQGLFIEAMRECCSYHYDHCEAYRRILDDAGFAPESLRKKEDIERLPFIPTTFLKKHHIFSMPKERMPIKATSSGTGGKYSLIGFDAGSLSSALKMVFRIYGSQGILSPVPCHYIIFGFKPHRSNHTAVAKTATGYTLLSPALSRTYALKFKDGKYEPDLEAVVNAFMRGEKSRFPVRTIGFPSYTWFALKLMEERGIKVKLAEGSKIMLAGGWKQFYREQVDKQEMYALVKKILGIPEENIFEAYGAVEHPILYSDCKRHHFHIPIYSRVVIRDVETFEPLPNGRIGLVNLITPMIKGTPVLSIMTDDLGVLHNEEECGCGIHSPYLEIIGRAGFVDIKTCAAGAEEILKGEKGT